MSGNGDLTINSLETIQEGNQSIIDNIKQLQGLEKELYLKLESLASTPNNSDEENDLISRINQLSQIRTSLFASLQQMSNTTQNTLATTRVDLVDQLTLIGVVEEELNRAKKLMNQSENIKNNKMRMVEINTYYGKRYQAYTDLMKILIKIFVPVLLIIILQKKELIPNNISLTLIVIIGILGSYFLIKKLYDILRRDNMNFDQYSWADTNKPSQDINGKYTPDKKAESLFDRLEGDIEGEFGNIGSSLGLGCVGSACCSDNMIYDKEKKKCMDKGNENLDNSVNSNNNVIEPFVYITPMPYNKSFDILTTTTEQPSIVSSYNNYM